MSGCFKLVVTAFAVFLFFQVIDREPVAVPTDVHLTEAGEEVFLARQVQRTELAPDEFGLGTEAVSQQQVEAISAELRVNSFWIHDSTWGRTWVRLEIPNPTSLRLQSYLLKVRTYLPALQDPEEAERVPVAQMALEEAEDLESMGSIAGPDAELRVYLSHDDFIATAQEVFSDRDLSDLEVRAGDTHYFELHGVEIEQGATAYPLVELVGFDLKAEAEASASIEAVGIAGRPD